jgi:hypothetical protein
VAPVNYLHEGSKAIDEGEQHISILESVIEKLNVKMILQRSPHAVQAPHEPVQ